MDAVRAHSDRADDRDRAKNCDQQRDTAAFENGGKTVHDHLRKNIFSARIAALRFDASWRRKSALSATPRILKI